MTLEPCPTCTATGRYEGYLCIQCVGSGQLQRLPLTGMTIAYFPLESYPLEIRPVIARLREVCNVEV